MITPQLINFIKSQLKENAKHSEVRESLEAAGWESKDINEAMYLASRDE